MLGNRAGCSLCEPPCRALYLSFPAWETRGWVACSRLPCAVPRSSLCVSGKDHTHFTPFDFLDYLVFQGGILHLSLGWGGICLRPRPLSHPTSPSVHLASWETH